MRHHGRTDRLRVGVVGALALSLLLAGGPAVDAPVADAAMRGDAAQVKDLLREGADVNAAQGDGMTALHWAGVKGDAEMARVLLYAGANPGAQTRVASYTPLHVASRSGSAGVIAELLEAGAAIDRPTATGVQAIHLAAESGKAEALRVLLDAGADIDAAEGASKQTPLMFAVAYDRRAAVDFLLERGADPVLTSAVVDFVERQEKDNADRRARARREAALRSAAEAEEEDEDEEEARPAERRQRQAGEPAEEAEKPAEGEAGAEAEKPAEAGAYPEAEAPTEAEKPAEAEEPAEAEKPTEAEEEAEAEEDEEEEAEPLSFTDRVGKQGGMSALHYAARDGRMEAAQALLAAGADVNQPTAGDRSTPLLVATINGQYDLAMYLLEQGADPNLASDDGATPLFTTINNRWAPKALYPQPTAFKQQRTDYLDMMKALLDAGADPNARLAMDLWYTSYNFDLLGVDMSGATPFWRAAYAQDVPAMKLLVAHGADPEIATRKTPQRRFRRGGDEEEEDKSGVPPVPTGAPAVYPIHAASGVGFGQEYAANAHRGAPGGWVPAVKYLVEELGADVNQRDHDAYTALHHAASRGDNELVLYLVSQGADVMVVSREGQTTVDMANGPQQRVQPYPETIALLESLGAINNHNCVTC